MGVFRMYELDLDSEGFLDPNMNGQVCLRVHGTKIMRSAAFLGRQGLLSMWQRGISIPESLGVAFMNCLRIQLLLSRVGDNLVPSTYYKNTANSTETGQHSNFIGEVFAETVSQVHLGVTKLIHLEQLIHQMGRDAFLFGGNRTPDFLGLNDQNHWMAIEAKGTLGNSDTITMRAQMQALGVQAVDGNNTIYNAVSKTYFNRNTSALSVRLQNQDMPAGVQVALNNINIDELNARAFDLIRVNQGFLEDQSEEVGNERVRFFRGDLFPFNIRGLQIRLGVVEGLLGNRNYHPQPFPDANQQDNNQGVEVFPDGAVVWLQGEIEE